MNRNVNQGVAVGTAREGLFVEDAPVAGVKRLIGYALGVNLNSVADTLVQLIMLPGSNFLIDGVDVNNASTSITTAAASVWSGAAGTGVNIVTTGVTNLNSLTAATKNLPMTLAGTAQTTVFNQTTQANVLYFKVDTAQGSAATADVYIFGRVLP
jgi:hypothetical protein